MIVNVATYRTLQFRVADLPPDAADFAVTRELTHFNDEDKPVRFKSYFVRVLVQCGVVYAEKPAEEGVVYIDPPYCAWLAMRRPVYGPMFGLLTRGYRRIFNFQTLFTVTRTGEGCNTEYEVTHAIAALDATTRALARNWCLTLSESELPQ